MVLLLGSTGRTGQAVLRQLLARGTGVRVVVRSAERLPPDLVREPRLAVRQADLLSLPDEELREHVRGCDVVISCLGHTISFHGLYGSPRDLVTQAVARLHRQIAGLRPARPVRLIVMSSVSVHHPGGSDTRRSGFDKTLMWLIRGVLPPAMDNQRVADFLYRQVGTAGPFIEWVAVRPDTLREGELSRYVVHESLVNSLLAPGSTNIANVAHFMCELATDRAAWEAWKGKLPVIVNAGPVAGTQPEA